MRYRHLGNSGLELSEAGLGANRFGEPGYESYSDVEPVVHAALDNGINFIDTSNVYGRGASESLIGRAIKGRRNQVVIGTKFGSMREYGPNLFGGSRTFIINSVEDSLRRLQTDWIDLYMIHRPDPRLPLAETIRAMDDLVRSGKVRYIGCCNFEAWRMVSGLWASDAATLERFASSQFEYSMLNRSAEAEMLPACRLHGVGVLPYLPLGAGMLTGKATRESAPPAASRLGSGWGSGSKWLTDANYNLVDDLTNWARQRDHTILDLAFAWLLAEPVVTSVIAGATSAEQIAQNVAASAWQLTPEERSEVDAILESHSVDAGRIYYSVAGYFAEQVEL